MNHRSPDEVEVQRWLEEVARGYPYGPRRGLDLVRPGTEAATTVAALAPIPDDPRSLLVHEADASGPIAATALATKPMETEQFGFVTASLANVVCPVDLPDRCEVVGRLLRRSLATAADLGVELVILRIDVDDVDTLAAAQAAGFAVCETTMTWLLDSRRAGEVPDHRPTVTCEIIQGEAGIVLDDAFVARFAAHTARWDGSHLRADPRLPVAAVERFYAAMIRNIVSGAWCDQLYVARHEGRIVGITSEVTDRLILGANGLDVRNAEWFGVIEPGVGGGEAMAMTVARHGRPEGTVHSWETQVRNLATIRCTENTRIARAVRSSYTLHAWPRSVPVA
jgi:hypothetical protein